MAPLILLDVRPLQEPPVVQGSVCNSSAALQTSFGASASQCAYRVIALVISVSVVNSSPPSSSVHQPAKV